MPEIKIMPLGKWEGHGNGPFEITPQHIQSAVDAFELRKVDTVVDYEHQTHAGTEAPAAGWIKKLVNKGADGLWAIVEWTKRAAEMIKSGEYRYLSPAFVFDAKDPKSGRVFPLVVMSAGLTNFPFFDELGEVQAKSAAMGGTLSLASIDVTNSLTFLTTGLTMDLEKIFVDLRAALKLPETADGNAIMERVKKLISLEDMAGEMGGEGSTPEAGMQDAQAALALRRDVLKALGITDAKLVTARVTELKSTRDDAAKLLGIDSAAAPAVFTASIAALKNGADASLYVSKAEHEKVTAQLAGMTADAMMQEFRRKVSPTDRDFWRAKAVTDPAGTREILAKLPDVIASDEAPKAKDAPKDWQSVVLDAEELTVCKRTGMAVDDYKKAKFEQQKEEAA